MSWKKVGKKIYKFLFGEKKIIEEIQGWNKVKKITRMPWVTFVIPARNEEKSIKRCIDSIEKDKYPRSEIIIIDDVSTDKTVDIVKKLKKKYEGRLKIKLILNKKRLGPNTNRNIGIMEGSGEFIIFLDAHSSIISKNFVKTYLKIFNDESIGAVAGARDWKPKYYQDKVMFYGTGIRPWREMGFQFLDGPNSAYRKSVLQKLNGLDLKVTWGSDISATFRVLDTGYRIVSTNKIRISVDHSVTPNRRIDFFRKPFFYGTDFYHIAKKYFKWYVRRKVDLNIVIWGFINTVAIILSLFNFSMLFWLPILTIFISRAHSLIVGIFENDAPFKYLIGMLVVLTISEISYFMGVVYGFVLNLFGKQAINY